MRKLAKGNGFVFKSYESSALLKELTRALKVYQDKKTWIKIQKNGMKCDFSWNSSAKKYIELYKTILDSE
jgi:starch synthase